MPIVCACVHPSQMYLQLRGLCPDTNMDRFYVPRNKEQSGAFILIGLKTSLISYDKVDLREMYYEGTTHNTLSIGCGKNLVFL